MKKKLIVTVSSLLVIIVMLFIAMNQYRLFVDFNEVQSKIYHITLDFELSSYCNNNDYPISGYTIKSEQVQNETDRMITCKSIPAVPNQLLNYKNNTTSHWDWMRLTPRPYLYVPPDVHSQFGDYSYFVDPFSEKGFFLSYISFERDFVIISFGPDKRADIFPELLQDESGEYHPPKMRDYTARVEYIKSRIGSLQSFQVDPNLIYDPTNGIISSGDIVFHRKSPKNFFFDVYERDLLGLDDKTFRKEEIWPIFLPFAIGR
jgi:hypothetical protein